MRGIMTCHPVNDPLRVCGPIGGGEGEAVISAGVERISLDGDAVQPASLNTQLETVQANEPVRRGHDFAHERDQRVIGVGVEDGLRPAHTCCDCRCREVVEDAI